MGYEHRGLDVLDLFLGKHGRSRRGQTKWSLLQIDRPALRVDNPGFQFAHKVEMVGLHPLDRAHPMPGFHATS